MGHHLGSKSSIAPLIDRLNQYPVGLPDNENLREILELLFSAKEAFVASRFPPEEATVAELSQRTGISAEELQPILEQMANKGLVMDLPYAGTVYYLLMPGLIGFFELTFMKKRSDLPQEKVARLMHEYMHDNGHKGMAREFFDRRTQLTRSLVYEDHVPVTSEVTTYESAREIIRAAEFGAVGMCYCRHKKEHLHQECSKKAPVEGICISLGKAGMFLTRRGFAEQKSTEALLAILDQARELRLTHVTDNIRSKPSFICNCCSCCCELMAGVQAGYHDGIGKTPFLAEIDRACCNGCGLCVPSCNVRAIASEEVVAGGKNSCGILAEICLGCGACLPACPKGAIALKARVERPVPPENRRILFKRMLKERGRLSPYLLSGVKRKIRKVFKG
jgi:Na+-translocating ferredoxin:NAD+ oxidoreductase RNF subunit RnfB